MTITKDLLAKPEFDVLPKDEDHGSAAAHELLDQLVLCTDFSWHKVFLDELSDGLGTNHYSYNDPDFLSLISRTLIKSADISNTSKPYDQARIWGERVMSEFWAQGEMEKKMNLPVGPHNDSEKTEFNTTQAGFIKFAARELFELLAKVEKQTGELLKQLNLNQQAYEQAAEETGKSLKQ